MARPPCRASTRSSDPGNRYVAAAKAHRRGRLRHRFLRGADRDRRRGRRRTAGVDCRRPVAQAEHDPEARAIFITLEPAARRRASRAAVAATPPGAAVVRAIAAAHGAIVVTGDRRRGDGARQSDRARASRLEREALTRRPLDGRRRVRRSLQRAGGRRLRDRVEPRAADGRRGALPRRAERRRFRPRDVGPAPDARRPRAARADDPAARACRRARGARRIDRGATANASTTVGHKASTMNHTTRNRRSCTTACACTRTRTPAAARLACSRRWRALRADQIGFYPPYDGGDGGVASDFGVAAGSHRAHQRPRRRHHGGWRSRTCGPPPAVRRPEAIVPEPAFEIFRVRHGSRRRRARAGCAAAGLLAFRSNDVLAAITPNTRVVFLTNPNNPTGVTMPLDAIRDDCRAACRRKRWCSWTRPTRNSPAITFIPELAALPNVDRRPHVFEGVRARRPPHRRADRRTGRARADPAGHSGVQREHRGGRRRAGGARGPCDYLDDYLAAGRRIEALLYAACDRLGLRYWKSAREFRAGPRRRSRRRARRGRRARAASTSATARPSLAARAASASAPASSRTPSAASRRMEEVLCAAR